jgi:hypothetical protein
MGGEPTIHPDFMELIESLLQRKRSVRIFSNFTTEIDPQLLSKSDELNISWIINANPSEDMEPVARRRFFMNLDRVGSAGALCYNFTGSENDYGYILEYLDRYTLAKELKIGISLPTLSRDNQHVSDPEFATVAAGVMGLVNEARVRNLSIEFECGVPLCLFSEAQRKDLQDIHVSHCGSRLDITPDGYVVNCLPLAELEAIPFDSFPAYTDARDWFLKSLAPYHNIGSRDECLTCSREIRQHCFACLSTTVSSMDRVSFLPLPNEKERRIAYRHKP